jgi:hypothetical protein
MKSSFLKIRQLVLIIPMLFFFLIDGIGQYKEFSLSPKGDTLNAIDNKGLKQGKWVNSVGEVRGEPGYEEEGAYKNDKKTGAWRKYNSTGDIIASEYYRFGGKDGVQQYFSFLGNLERQEEWRGYNPDAPYDTIAIYGSGNNEVIDYKIVKAEQYSVPHGEWKYFDAGGRLMKIERFDRGAPIKDEVKKTAAPVAVEANKSKERVKTKEIMEYEKKYSKKKRQHMEREGKTSL